MKNEILFKEELNAQQLEVVKAGKGPILTIAGAGSGKTRTLTYRVAHLIESGVEPYRILLLTFTNKAAREMMARVEAIIPYDVNKIWSGTFHHIANRIIRVHAKRLGFEPNYTILDQGDSRDLLDSCLQELGYKKKDSEMPQGAVLFNLISLSRNTRLSLEEILEQRFYFFSDHLESIVAVEKLYTEKKAGLNVFDFDDLLCKWLLLMKQDTALKEFYSQRFEYILVDEYQDTNKLQADIIDLLASHHQNLMVVGDDAQSIYAFRGANFANIMDFPTRYPDAKIFKLEYNYRSSPEILSLANEVIVWNKKQFPKKLQPVNENISQPQLVTPENVYEQAEFVANKIQEHIYNGVSPREIAVLYRAHFHSMELQMVMNQHFIPFIVHSGIRFFEQAHIKDMVSNLKVVINPYDELAWKRLLQLLPGIGKKISQNIFNVLAGTKDPLKACLGDNIVSKIPKKAMEQWQSLKETISCMVETGTDVSPGTLIEAAYEKRYRDNLRSKYVDSARREEDINQFIEFAMQYKTPDDFLSDIALMTSAETEQVQDEELLEKVTLSTIHQAKGLEWAVVFIIWLTEGRFPNQNNIASIEEEEEERRLFYVALTRAKKKLYLCAPKTMKDNSGYIYAAAPSKFLREIPGECYSRWDETYDC